MSKRRVHHVKDKKQVVRRYRTIPYGELVEILGKGDEAFFEDSSEQPLKRQTVWKAARRLSELVGKRVVAERALLRVQDGEAIEGYAFSLAENKS
jgi:hypothetical protein